MTNRARFDRKAEAWFLAQIDKISDDNPTAASDLIDRMEEIRVLAAEWPRVGKRGKVRNTRHITMPPFVVTIRRNHGVVEIVAVRHGRQRDAYAPGNLRARRQTSPDEIRRMALSRKIVHRAELIGSETIGNPEQAALYLVDVATEEELTAMVGDLASMEEFVDFLRKYGVHFKTYAPGR